MSGSVSIRVIAQKLGISASTVSRVLSGKQGIPIAEDTRQRVLDTAKDLGYQVNRFAQSMVKGRTDTIEFWSVSQPATAWASATLFSRLIELCDQDGFSVVQSSFPTQHRFHPDKRLPAPWPADCRIAFACENYVKKFIEEHPQDRRIVYCSNETQEGLDWVEVNVSAAGYLAAKQLVDIGCKRIVHFQTKYIETNPHDSRLAGYQRAMKEAGLPDRVVICKDETQTAGYDMVQKLLEEGAEFDGILCRRDELAIGAMLALRTAGRSIPDDVAIMGFNGIPEAGEATVPISTFMMPLAQIAEAAWELAKHRIAHPEAGPQHVRVEYQFVERASTQRA